MKFRTALVAIFTATIAMAAANLLGTYSGTWSGTSSNGPFHLAIREANGKPEAQVSFGLGGIEVKTKVVHLTIDGTSINCRYQFDIGGANLESAIQGSLAGDTLSGKYTTRTVEGGDFVDEGEWKAERRK